MTSITIKANGVSLTVSVDGKITTGMVGVPVSVEFDSAWDNLVTKVLFRVGDRVRVMTDNTVPWELLRSSGDLLEVGCEGRNEDDTLIIPTVWTAVSRIAEGASGEIPAAPTPGTSTNGAGGGPNTIIVTITDDVASHTSAEIYAHVQAGGTAVLLLDGIFFSMTRASANHAEFSTATDENLIDYIEVNEDGSVERIEHIFVSKEMFDGLEESDPTVPAWAKAEKKPTYTAAEVGALSADALPGAVDQALAQAKESGEFDGAPGKDGKDGLDATPVTPLFVNTIEECTDTTKPYVLPDGFIYAYIMTTVTKPDQPQYTNVLPTAIDSNKAVFNGTGYKNGFRLNSSATEKEASGCGYTGFIKVTPGQSNVIRMKNIELCSEGYHYVHGYDTSFVRQGTALQNSDMLTKDANGVVTFEVYANWEYIRISNGVMNAGTIITVNEEIKVIPGGTTTEYRWTNTGHAFVPADYEDRIVAVENKATSNAERITVLENKPSGEITLFIDPTGNDSNDGLTASTPKKTVKACVNAGASRISAKRGIYNESINLRNIDSLEIFPTDNEKTYVVGESRDPIVFDTSDLLAATSVASYNSIKRIAYSNASNTAYDKVFVQKTLEPTVSASQSSYHAALWLFSDDEKTVCRKPKPVLTIAECEAEANTFCYSGGYIYINADMAGVTKIIVPTIAETGFYVNGADKLSLCEVEVRFSGEYTFDLQNCAFVDLYKCASKYTTRASGFHPVNTNGVFRACYATKCFDGFAPNGHGHTTYIDCASEYNFDDGMSHHSGTEGTVIGGRYEGNGKGGNTPAYGAKVNIYGGLYKNNAQFGIGYVGDEASGYVSGVVQGAVMVSNPVGLLVQANCEVTAISCKYTGNTSDKSIQGVLTEY